MKRTEVVGREIYGEADEFVRYTWVLLLKVRGKILLDHVGLSALHL